MTPYKNRGGRSGIVAYEQAASSITVEFKNGKKYQYNSASAGSANVDHMKALAQQGQGLGTFIDKVRPPYASKSS